MACWAELRKPFLLDSSPFVEVDRERLSDPYYLSLSRHFQTLAIAQAKRGLWGLENTLRKVEATGLLFPREIKMCLEDDKARCELLMVGVDRNHFVQRNKGETRPINDFPVRVGTLNGISEIDIIFPCNVDEIARELYFGKQAYNVSEFVFGPLFGLSFFLSPESLSLLSDPQERERVISGLKQEHGLFYGFPGKVTLFISETDPH